MIKINIIGGGRIANALLYYIDSLKINAQAKISEDEKDIQNADLLIGVLPSIFGEQALEYALKYKKDLIDLADLETDFYIENENKINEAGIKVLPGAGFCPGLVNFILGHEFSQHKKIDTLEVKAGSISEKPNFYPFLWCFEDMVLEFLNPSIQLVNKKQKKFEAFAGFETETLFGIETESYLCQSGFENLLDNAPVEINNFYYRNVRPVGFKPFFEFMHNYGFFKEENREQTKAVVENAQDDNISLSTIKIENDGKSKKWVMKSFSKVSEDLNSMQKITSLYAIAMIKLYLDGKIDAGLTFGEKLGAHAGIFDKIISFMNKNGVEVYSE